MFSRTFAVRAGSAALAAPCRSCTRSFGMPLRAKIITAQASSRAQMSTEVPKEFRERRDDEVDDVLFNSLYGVRTIQLNRPKKLNSLNASMIRKILPRLVEWEKSDMANVVIMKGSGEKAFCAGGDVAELAKYNQESEDGWKKSADYFALEYKLDHYIATYDKPYIAFMDGITMGGGVGLSIHAPFRIATERSVFAMPETTIGFFPDVGASFFLPRMPGAVGTYLALTSERLKGANVFYSGVATHYLHSTSLPQLESRLAEIRFDDRDSLEKRLQVIGSTLEEFATGLPHDEPILLGGELRKAVDRCFSKSTVQDIISALKAEEGATKQWAEKTLDTLHKRSPTAVNVALRQMRIGGGWSIKETFQREHQIATKFMQHPDFTEGVTALLVRKETPKWQPATLEDIKPEDKVADPFFKAEGEELQMLNDRDFKEYRYPYFALPTENEVKQVVLEGQYTPKQVVKKVVANRNGRQGVAEVVREVVSRKVVTNEAGRATWSE
ncbi:mitochondrial 37S ribosomal protein mS47 [Colletotrichum truncatum]|uniref:3-hydroxyisobutyryl-CoA hydrolase (Enoyl-CoA hydratase/isomerase) n=1 Tax=Colletotrichum truncatum TaxID=5467 RepID=A0ACC3ZI01_COLTU|nr:3-hydroxyisobutyryl-CoA hydrolase (enoyl-CoA hydratase/isomerase) [Colletotrichum truncatum]KAF6786752.1 3-hydroxyisobutyryl-CoA hydrolase (enoyl-CoA hydratase/isomerase) [Colletotrichum truncatum]